MRKLAARLLRWLAEVAVRFYYPRRTVEGLGNVPADGGAVYVANHPNGLLDPLVLRVAIGRRARFLAKSTLWGNPFGRLAMDAFECLPVYRQADVGTGEQRSETVSRNEETFARCRGELDGRRAGRRCARAPARPHARAAAGLREVAGVRSRAGRAHRPASPRVRPVAREDGDP